MPVNPETRSRPLVPPPWAFKTPGGLRIVDVRTSSDLARHAAAWDGLLDQSPAASPMLSYPQISAFFETQVSSPESWLCLFAYEDDRLIGVFPLIATRSYRVAGFAILCLKTPYDILHTGGVDCLTLRGREEILEVFFNYLSRIPRTWPLIRIRELPENSPSMTYINRPGANLSFVTKQTASENYIEVPACHDDFHAKLSSNFRRQLKRGFRKLEEQPDVVFLCREQTRSTAENMHRFEEVEDAGWKGAAQSSVKAMPQNARLYAIAAERFAERGWMEWNFLEVAGKPVGAHYAVRIRRTLFLLKIGYDEAYSAVSPGNLLLDRTIRRASEAGDLDEINCVADCAWHRNWVMKNRLLHDLLILPRVPLVSPLVQRAARSLWAGNPESAPGSRA